MLSRYQAMACQTIVRPITEDVASRDDAMAIVGENLEAGLSLMWKGLGNNLGAVKLVTFPEMFLTLAPVGWRNRPSSDWLELACIELPGPEIEPLLAAAKEANVYIAANAYEYDPKWPNRYFNSCFLVDPNGEIILKYRRLHSPVTPSPHDFLDEYVAELGWDALFPVADTELGRIAMFPCMEVIFPEVGRMYALQGAEVLINPTNDSADVPGWTACKQARAMENNCYLISTNAGGWVTKRGLLESTNAGGTIMVDYRGTIFEEHRPAGESMKARGLIDIEQLRAYRHSANAMNFVPQLRTELYTGYQKTVTPPNRFKDPMHDHAELRKLYGEVMQRLKAEGVYPAPKHDD
ncbi:MAG: nitrilase-related carbon-nitrogen hydrolase [Gammaproteobacteria bacterium]|nr:nitrilase-related carbon-nitrogen hydrolase [Gammaproteobacteria bacterium]